MTCRNYSQTRVTMSDNRHDLVAQCINLCDCPSFDFVCVALSKDFFFQVVDFDDRGRWRKEAITSSQFASVLDVKQSVCLGYSAFCRISLVFAAKLPELCFLWEPRCGNAHETETLIWCSRLQHVLAFAAFGSSSGSFLSVVPYWSWCHHHSSYKTWSSITDAVPNIRALNRSHPWTRSSRWQLKTLEAAMAFLKNKVNNLCHSFRIDNCSPGCLSCDFSSVLLRRWLRKSCYSVNNQDKENRPVLLLE